MQEYLPLVIGFLVLAFRVYSNFKKEQEKVKKRDFSRPSRPEDVEPDSRTVPEMGEQPGRTPVTMEREEFLPYEPRYEAPRPETRPRETYREPQYEPMRPIQVHVADGRSPEPAAEEILRGRAIHAGHPHKFEPHEESHERSAYADFDMEDAVIKAAILNRPEY